MKIERHGQAKIFTQQEIELLFNKGLQTDRDRTLFGVCLYTACRIAEACSLSVADIGVADLRYERLNMQIIETSIHKASGFSTYFFHTLIKQRPPRYLYAPWGKSAPKSTDARATPRANSKPAPFPQSKTCEASWQLGNRTPARHINAAVNEFTPKLNLNKLFTSFPKWVVAT
ncbi:MULTISPECIES: hypothetical protein [unclassified Microcoleus]|uniref:hypothetical protein n=1 Tax=unclassified Microcoleus TaxID=2642155 RepID=UPI002FCF16AB